MTHIYLGCALAQSSSTGDALLALACGAALVAIAVLFN